MPPLVKVRRSCITLCGHGGTLPASEDNGQSIKPWDTVIGHRQTIMVKHRLRHWDGVFHAHAQFVCTTQLQNLQC